MWVFASEVERQQEIAVGRLPKNVKESTRDHTRQRVLELFLGIEETASTPGRFRDPQGR